MFNIASMTNDEITEYQNIVSVMVERLNDANSAKRGQIFHSRIAKKYGKNVALEMTDAMMDSVCEMRLSRELRNYLVFKPTGEVLECNL